VKWIPIIAVFITTTCLAADEVVVPFEAAGSLVDIHSFFARTSEEKPEVAGTSVAGLGFVVNDQVYAFVESPEDEQILAGIEPGAGLLLAGKLFVPGALRELESATFALDEANLFAQKRAESEGV